MFLILSFLQIQGQHVTPASAKICDSHKMLEGSNLNQLAGKKASFSVLTLRNVCLHVYSGSINSFRVFAFDPRPPLAELCTHCTQAYAQKKGYNLKLKRYISKITEGSCCSATRGGMLEIYRIWNPALYVYIEALKVSCPPRNSDFKD